jgi:hypothetical protein
VEARLLSLEAGTWGDSWKSRFRFEEGTLLEDDKIIRRSHKTCEDSFIHASLLMNQIYPKETW